MEAKVRIEGVPPFDGEYPFDFEKLNARDWHTIKVVAGVRANELEEAVEAGDLDLVVAFAVCALHKAGHKMNKEAIDALWDAETGKITFDAGEEEEADAGPPAQTPPAEPEGGGEKNGSSGRSSSTPTADFLATRRSPTGSRRSG